MRVLVTRPAEDSAATAARLAVRGHESVLAPLMAVRSLEEVPDFDGVQSILITSANGVRALADAVPQGAPARNLPVYTVGRASADAARAAGFADVTAAGGDVDHLAGMVKAMLRPADGALLHVAGTVTAGDLSGSLSEVGFAVRRAVLYAAEPVSALPAAAHDALAAGRIDAVMLFSPRTARLFAALVRAAGLDGLCRAMIALCLSPAVAEALEGLAFSEIRVAASPDQDSLLALLHEDDRAGMR